jgi:hypothetical protein
VIFLEFVSREFQLERRLERGCCFIERLAPNMAVGPHNRRRDVTHLRLDHPVRLPLLGQARERSLTSVVEAHVIQASCLSQGIARPIATTSSPRDGSDTMLSPKTRRLLRVEIADQLVTDA